MKIVVTGSLGHISRPLIEDLVQKGHAVTVVSSKSDRQQDIEDLGAKAAIGSLEDGDFLTSTFTGADAAYCMIPPANYFDHTLDLLAYYRRLATNYAQAIKRSSMKRVINLSSIGADLSEGNGILKGTYHVEQILNGLPPAVALTHLRPTSFYYNLYGYVDMIKNGGLIAANYGADQDIVWVSPVDIAAVVSEELLRPSAGKNVRYVASDERTGTETARILGEAIGKPDLKWVLVSGEQVQQSLAAIGMNPQIAAGLAEMYGSWYDGKLAAEYYRNKPALGKVKLEEFASEFAAAFTVG